MCSLSHIRQDITQQIICALRAGVLPWCCPWRLHPNAGPPTSLVSRKLYRGDNICQLEMHAMHYGLGSKWWGTFSQINAMGGRVKRRPPDVPFGQWGCQILVYRPYTKTVVNKATGEARQEAAQFKRRVIVFNADQTEGAALDQFRVVEEEDKCAISTEFSRVEEVIAATHADIRIGGERAYYTRPQPAGSWPQHASGDFIVVPRRGRFFSRGAFYETVFHELAHWSEVRIGWDRTREEYATGELIAELVACFLAAELGVPQPEPLRNHAAFIGHSLGEMRDDADLIAHASSQASKVCDFLLSHVAQAG